jgi:hypothetical protein
MNDNGAAGRRNDFFDDLGFLLARNNSINLLNQAGSWEEVGLIGLKRSEYLNLSDTPLVGALGKGFTGNQFLELNWGVNIGVGKIPTYILK